MGDIERHFPQCIGANTFEEICREWVWLASKHELFAIPEEVGSTWTRAAQIDIVGIHWSDCMLVLGEAKWTKTKEKLAVLQKLVDQIDLVVPGKGSWEIHSFRLRDLQEMVSEFGKWAN